MRVIAGTAKGRPLRTPRTMATRPVTDRAKESLFAILGPRLAGARFLDLFAGTGGIGIEALSRGSAHATFVERSARALADIRHNLAVTGLTAQAAVVGRDVFAYLRDAPAPFDLVFVGPPQWQGLWPRTLRLLDEQPGWLSDDAVVIAQHDPDESTELDLRHLSCYDERSYGRVRFTFFRRVPAAVSPTGQVPYQPPPYQPPPDQPPPYQPPPDQPSPDRSPPDQQAWPDIAHAYDVAAQTYADRFGGELDAKPFDRDLLDRYAATVAGQGPVWDVGCGAAGHIGGYLADRGVTVAGTDLSAGCTVTASRHRPDLRFFVADMCALPARDAALAGAVAFYSVIHLPRSRVPAAFAEFRRVLRPGGQLLVTMHGGEGELASDDAFGHGVSVRATLVTVDELTGLASEAGFTIRETHTQEPIEGQLTTQRLYLWAQAPAGR